MKRHGTRQLSLGQRSRNAAKERATSVAQAKADKGEETSEYNKRILISAVQQSAVVHITLIGINHQCGLHEYTGIIRVEHSGLD